MKNKNNLTITLSLLGLAGIGLLAIWHASLAEGEPWLLTQAVAFLLGTVLCFFLARFSHPWKWRAVPALLFSSSFLLLLAVFFLGHRVSGHQSWLKWGPVSFQPSEWAKSALAIFLAFRLAQLSEKGAHWFRITAELAAWTAIPTALILLQGDFGSAVLLAGTAIPVFFLCRVPKRFLWLLFLLGLLTSGILYQQVLSPYQKARLATVLHPEKDPQGSGYQVTQAKITIGSGGLWGKGIGKGTHYRLHYLPAEHSDFIFCVVAEEGGFLGSAFLLLLYALLLFGILQCGREAHEPFGRYLPAFVAFSIFLHLFVNLGGTTGLIPMTGVPLPFLSYGGSSVVSLFFLIGTLLAQGRAPNWGKSDFHALSVYRSSSS